MPTTSLFFLLTLPGFSAGEEAKAESNVLLEDYAPCGVVSLYLVCRMREIPVTWEQIKELIGPAGPDGSHSFDQLSQAAARLGLHPVGLQVNREGLSRLPMPLIAQVHNPHRSDLPYHLLVLLKPSSDGVTVLDAPFSPSFLPSSDFHNYWTGNVLVFAPDAEFARALRTTALARTGQTAALWVWSGIGVGLLLLAFAASQARCISLGLRRSKRLLSASLMLLLLPALIWGLVKLTAKTNPHCVVDTPVINLGELALGEHSISVTLTNPGDQPLHVSAIKSSCTCVVVKHPETVDAKQRATIEVHVYVSPGPRNARLEILSNDTDGAKNVLISWHGTTAPFLIPDLIRSLPVPFDRDYERIVHVVYPGGKTALVPQFERFECDSPLVDVRQVRNNPTTRRYSRSGLITDVQGELDLHFRIQAPTKSQSLQTECKLFIKYGKSRIPLILRIFIPFTTGAITSDVDTITFAAARWEELNGQMRLVQISVRDAKSNIRVRQLPDWLECTTISRTGNKIVLALKMTARPPEPFVSANLRLEQGSGDSSILHLPVRAFASRN